jgi:hypothetical protein
VLPEPDPLVEPDMPVPEDVVLPPLVVPEPPRVPVLELLAPIPEVEVPDVEESDFLPGVVPDCPGVVPDCPGVVPARPGAVPVCPGAELEPSPVPDVVLEVSPDRDDDPLVPDVEDPFPASAAITGRAKTRPTKTKIPRKRNFSIQLTP